MIHNSLSPGSYIFSTREPVLEVGSRKLEVPKDRLHTHPDFYLIKSEGSIGIDIIREVGHFLRIKPIASPHKILVIENFHLVTEEAQNAFLKTFEEPPEYAYIFLITPYIDRLLKTVVSRAQIIEGIKNQELGVRNKNLQPTTYNLQALRDMSIGERFLWLENEIKHIDDKIQVKLKLLEMIDSLLIEGVVLVKEGVMSLEALECLKEARWKIEQGFPNPRLLVEEFLLILQGENS